MAAFNPFNSFVEEALAGSHDNVLNADTGAILAYLSNTAPNAASHAVKADLAEITNQNGYTAPVDIANAASQTGAIVTVAATDQEITATGEVGPFRYVVFYNDDTTGDMLIGWHDYGEAVTLQTGEKFTIDFDDDELLRIGFGLA